MNILIDKETDLNSLDLLNTKSYSKTLEKTILEAPENTSLTIGLFGEWGSGKSSIVKTVRSNLESNPTINIKFIVYDAWKYSNDSFRRMFLMKVKDELSLPITDKMSSFYSTKNSDIRVERNFNIPHLFLMVIVLFVGIFIARMAGLNDSKSITLTVVVSLIGFLATVFSKAFNEYKVSVQEPLMFAPEQFEECFNEIVAKALKKVSPLEKINNYINGKGRNDIDKLVIVIDNIDRCHRDTAYELLTNTKNFIDSHFNIIFLIPVDDAALKKHIFKNDNTEGKESEEFLRKYFNITLRIKPYKLTEIFDFASSINNQSSIGFQPDTINIIAKEYASNPRRIIQFFNNLQIELSVMTDKYENTFCQENQKAICKFLIIKEEWPSYYKQLYENPEHFFSEYIEPQNQSKELSSFLFSTKVVTRNLTYETLQKILINSDNYDKLPEIISQNIQEKGFENFDLILQENDKSLEQVINFLLFDLQKALRSQLFSTDVPLLLDNIYILFTQYPDLDIAYNNRLENLLTGHQNLVLNSLSFDNFVNYNNVAISKGLNLLDSYVDLSFDNYNLTTQTTIFENKSVVSLYRSYLEASSKEQIVKIKSLFLNFLKAIEFKYIKDLNLKPFQIDGLFTTDIITHTMFEPEKALWENEDNYYNWIHLSEHLTDQSPLIMALIDQFKSTTPSPLSNEQIEHCIRKLESILAKCINTNLPPQYRTDLDNLNETLLGSRPNPNYPATESNRITSYIDTVTDENIIITVTYILNCYSVNTGNTFEWIYKLLKTHHSDTVENELLKLSETGVSVPELKPIVLEFSSLNDTRNKIILKSLYSEHNSIAIYNDDEIEKPLTLLIEGAKLNPDHALYLQEHVKIKRGKETISKIVSGFNSEEMLKLPLEVIKVAFTHIISNISKYKNNPDVLNTIVEHGDEKHIKGLLPTIKSHLLDTETADQTLGMINRSKNLTNEIANTLISFIDQNGIKDVADKEKLKQTIEILKKK